MRNVDVIINFSFQNRFTVDGILATESSPLLLYHFFKSSRTITFLRSFIRAMRVNLCFTIFVPITKLEEKRTVLTLLQDF